MRKAPRATSVPRRAPRPSPPREKEPEAVAGWVRMLENARNASGQERFPLIYYEGLQRDPRAEIGRLFAHLGLPAPVKIKLSGTANVKLTSDDLRDSVLNFSEVEDDLERSPCLAEQLRAASFEIFPALCLEGDPHLKALSVEFPHLHLENISFADYDILARDEYE